MNPTRWARLAGLLALGGCPGCLPVRETCQDLGSCEDTGLIVEPPECATNGLREVWPATKATGVFPRPRVSVSFLMPESDVRLNLIDDAGAEVPLGPLVWSEDRKTAWVAAPPHLAPATEHTLTVAYNGTGACGRVATVPFTTADVGAPVGAEAVDGRTFVVDLATLRVVVPAGLNQSIGALLLDLTGTLALRVHAQAPGGLSIVGGVLEGAEGAWTQDTCDTTFEVVGSQAFVDDPFFAIDAPEPLAVSVGGAPIDVRALRVSGGFGPGADAILGLSLAITIDTRPLVSWIGAETLGVDAGPEAVCDLFGTYTSGAMGCEPCPDEPSTRTCLTLEAVDGVAARWDDDLRTISAEEVAANGACSDG